MPRMSLRDYVKIAINKDLYPYQEEILQAILKTIFSKDESKKGLTFTVMMARQMGKNETSAILEAFLLTCLSEGIIIKAAPTYKPQVINSRLRLLSILENEVTRGRIWRAHGYTIGVTPPTEPVASQGGPRIMFFSASPDANIVGATASLLLEVDEAQDVNVDKFNRDLRPMASTTNATTVLWGTAWNDDTLLAQVKAVNQELQQRDGIQRHFQYDWTVLARINDSYKRFVENEIDRLGEEHPTIRTQYRLLPIVGMGYLLNGLQRHLLDGQHKWREEPGEDEDGYYVAGMDVGGEERVGTGQAPVQGKRDSTVISIGRVSFNELALPKIEVVHQYWFTGVVYANQYAMVSEIMQRWSVRRMVVDATGLGEALGSLLIDRFTDERVLAFRFSRPSKSKLTYQFLSMINAGRLQMYAREEAPEAIYNECWKQLSLARYNTPGEGLMNMYVSPEEGHDDFLMSLALCCQALKEWNVPIAESAIIRPKPMYTEESWY